MSSGIFAQAQSYGSVCFEKNVNFYQLEKAKSTRGMSARERKFPSPHVILGGVIVSRSETITQSKNPCGSSRSTREWDPSTAFPLAFASDNFAQNDEKEQSKHAYARACA
jgi:hypothetical protein